MAGRASIFLGLKYGTGDVIAQHAAMARHDDSAGASELGAASAATAGAVASAGADAATAVTELDQRRAGMFYAFGGAYGVVFYNVVRMCNAVPIPNPWVKAVVCSLFDGFVPRLWPATLLPCNLATLLPCMVPCNLV